MINEYGILAEHIVEKYIERISGSDICGRLIGESPIERVMVGMLSEDRMETGLDGVLRENMDSKFESVPSISISFIVDKNEGATIRIKPFGLLFYNVLPEYDEVVEYVLKKYSEQDNYKYKDIAELCDKYPIENFYLPMVYRKIDIAESMGDGVELSISNLKDEKINLESDITEKLLALKSKIQSEICVVNASQISFNNLISEHEFRKICSKKDVLVDPRWKFDIICHVKEGDDCYRISLQLVNNTPIPQGGNIGYIPKLFNAGISVVGNEEVVYQEIDLNCFDESFKEKEKVYAITENASVKYISSNNELRTDNVPIYYQYRLKTNDEFNDYIKFEELINAPIENLKYILGKMQDDFELRKNEVSLMQGLSNVAMSKLQDSLDDYETEIRRFGAGIAQIEFKDDVYKAFIYMNKTFATQLPNDKGIVGWRLFQIVFVVSLLPEIIRSEYLDDTTIADADLPVTNLLYFPTGGGKTEAFLGACVFSMFFDRIRGKNEGVTAILKYPLRLLAVQQLERVLKTVMKANVVREASDLLKSTSPFRVGFFVGKDNTPNNIKSIELTGNDKITLNLETDEDALNEHYRFIDTCPLCGEKSIRVKFDKVEWRLKHICTNSSCMINELPLLIVDNEIYRYLPSVVVSTIDKMAMLGTTNEFRQLFGQVKGSCSRHGFSTKGICGCGDPKCTEKILPVRALKDPAPTLYIQDEMHLVRESLGTFDAHYESFIAYYVKELMPEAQRKRVCFIGATATVSQYEEHIRELYHTEGRRFPCVYPSIEAGKDFYSYTDYDDLTRVMLGYAPYGRTVTNAIWESLYNMRTIVYKMMKEPDESYMELHKKGLSVSLDEYKEMLLNYWINIVYNNRKNDVYEVQNTLQNQANNKLEQDGIPKFNVAQMTSDEDFQSVRKTLFEIQENKRKLDEKNVILATSTISHGVDEDAFNVMYFYGMPSNNAEYIQAYSRTGRKYTGIVIDIIRLLRIRDRSYLKNFVIFHQNKDELVEAVPINRWAKNAIYSTLPGLIASLIHQYYTVQCNKESLYMAADVKQLINNGQITEDDLIEKLIGIYGCNNVEKISLSYEQVIREQVHSIIDGIANATFERKVFIGDAISKFSRGKKKPMTSLRDTEETIEIKIGD